MIQFMNFVDEIKSLWAFLHKQLIMAWMIEKFDVVEPIPVRTGIKVSLIKH